MGSAQIRAALAAALAFGLAACGGGRASSDASATAAGNRDAIARVGQPAPEFAEPTAAGGRLDLASLRGHPVYLNFFASWCPPCNDEAPSIEALQRRYAAQGLQVVGVDVLENAAKAKQFVAEHRLSYPAVVDDGTLRDQYRIDGLPVHVFIDRGGVVRNIVIGQLQPGEMQDDVKAILR